MEASDAVRQSTAFHAIGQRRPRPETRRALEGNGRYLDDIHLPRMLHAAFLRSPHAKAAILGIDIAAALQSPGVAHVFVGADFTEICRGWRGNSAVLAGLNSPLQRPLAVDRVTFQGEPVALVLAQSRSAAEDALGCIEVDWEVEPATGSLISAATDAPIHPDLKSNVGFQTTIGSAESFAEAARQAQHVIEETLFFTRHTGMPLETRGLIASYNTSDGTLLVHHSHQTPNEIQSMLATIFDLGQHNIRILSPDIGGGFGIKLHLYPDEVAVIAASLRTGRPVKFVADRLESFVSDVHAREHRVVARIAVGADQKILGFDINDLCGMGGYSVHPRTSVAEALLAMRCIGTPYDFPHFHATIEAVFQNRPPTGAYRGVGTPIGCAVTEHLVDRAAATLGVDRVAFRRRNLLSSDRLPLQNPCGLQLFDLSNVATFDKTLELMQYDALAAERDRLRTAGIYRGIGLAPFVELTAPGPEINGPGQLPITALESAVVKIEPSGVVRCLVGLCEIGQGARASMAQVAADAIGVPVDQVQVMTGDTAAIPAGGGAWASRSAALGGEAIWRAGRTVRAEILKAAANLLQSSDDDLDIADGMIVDRTTRAARMPLRELAEIIYYRGHLLPPGPVPQLSATEQFRRIKHPFIPTNGTQAASVEVDIETGIVKVLGYWVVEDCGRIINPLLVDEQIRGGVVQGIGEALFEALHYDDQGQLLTGSFADYLLPMAGDIPDIVIGHVETPYSGSELGAKGVGEAGTCGASAAILSAVNDAIAPLGAIVRQLPITPAMILDAVEAARS
ncbi:MAG: xanthine dehydrogenase family protein molybdopterin-binding subunit [Pseudolabrys sp.]